MENDHWYYAQRDSAIGPVTWDQLGELLDTGVIDRDTLVWREGTEEWAKLRTLVGDLIVRPPPLPQPPPIPDYETVREQGRAQRTGSAGPTPRPRSGVLKGWTSQPTAPWRRYLARMIDTWFNGGLTSFLIGVVFYSVAPISADQFYAFLGSEGRIVDAMLTIVIAIPLNASLIGLTGSSLGKWIVGIKVLDKQRRPLGIGKAFRREIGVWTSGLGLGIPIVIIFIMIASFRRLKNEGITPWDQEASSIVIHPAWGWPLGLRAAVGVVLFMGLVFLYAGLGNI